jgi:hypothetical protein
MLVRLLERLLRALLKLALSKAEMVGLEGGGGETSSLSPPSSPSSSSCSLSCVLSWGKLTVRLRRELMLVDLSVC